MRIISILLMLSCLALVCLALPANTAHAQSPAGDWTNFENISDTPTASTYPCIVADRQGFVHVLWSEDVGGITSNPLPGADGSPARDMRGKPINYLVNSGNTLYYNRWDGHEWLDPIDVQVNPNGLIEYPRAVVSPDGYLNAVWVSTEGPVAHIFFSRALAGKAESNREWSPPIMLVDQTLAAYYPMDLAVDSRGVLYLFYVGLGPNPGAYLIKSSDQGVNWSSPVQVFSSQDPRGEKDGISTVGLVIDAKGRLHATGSRYDASGNGKALYYSQSTDFGETWTQPLEVARWQPGWYETDWLSAGVVDDEIHLVWEGGKIAYLNERISRDGGQTWGENQRILPNLVGENGYANLVVDSANQLHLLVVKRGELADVVHGIWYATWQGDHWANPILLGARNLLLYWKMNLMALNADTRQELADSLFETFTGDGLRYQMATIVNGNQLFVVVVNEWDGDIWSSHTTLDAPLLAPKPYPQPTPSPMPAVTSLASPEVTSQPQATPTLQLSLGGPPPPVEIQPTNILLWGVIPAAIILFGILIYFYVYKRG